MFVWHKKLVKSWQEKLGLSNYLVAWISYFKGLIFGLLIYHFLLNKKQKSEKKKNRQKTDLNNY